MTIQCNELANPHNLSVGKFKIKRSVKYCITLDGYEVLSNGDIVAVHKFCQNENDLAMLSDNAVSMVKIFKAHDAKAAEEKTEISA